MTTSGTFNFSNNTRVALIITEAFERIGLFGEQVSGDMMSSAIHSFNFMLNSWTRDESKQWALTSLEQYFPAVGQTSFQLNNGQYDVLDMIYRQNGVDIGMSQISRDEYLLINVKTVQSTPVQYFCDKSTYPPTIYLYPVPNSTTISLIFTAVNLPQDIDNPAFLAAVTPWWLEAMAMGLAARLAAKFKPEAAEQLRLEADQAYRESSRADVDNTSCRIRTPYKFG